MTSIFLKDWDSMDFLLAWVILALGVFVAAKILPGVQVPSFWDAVVVAAVFGVLNFFLGWLMFVVIGIFTLGIGFLLAFITRLIVNAILLKMTDDLTHRITIVGFGNAVLAALIISGVGVLADALIY
jgi:putative membrane protein